MKCQLVVVCATLAVFGIVSAVAGLAAEATKIKLSDVHYTYVSHTYVSSCIYPSSPALGLGILAAVCAIINQTIILMVVGCCSCSCSPSGSILKRLSNLSNILSWLASVIAVILLVIGADSNDQGGRIMRQNGTSTCYVVRPGIFTLGAALSLLSAFLGIVSYVCVYTDTRKTSKLESALPVCNNVDGDHESKVIAA